MYQQFKGSNQIKLTDPQTLEMSECKWGLLPTNFIVSLQNQKMAMMLSQYGLTNGQAGCILLRAKSRTEVLKLLIPYSILFSRTIKFLKMVYQNVIRKLVPPFGGG